MSTATARRRPGALRSLHWRLLPPALLVVLTAADIADGTRTSVIGTLVTVPLVASLWEAPAVAWGYGAVAVVTAALLGIWDHSYAAVSLSSQTERLVVIAGSGALAGCVSAERLRRERRFLSTSQVAEALQRFLLPTPPPQVGPVAVAASYRAAAESARVGGDLFDVRADHRGVRVLVGDVRGKGLEAVRLAAAVLGSFRERSADRDDLVALLGDLDRAVLREAGTGEDFVTAVVAHVDHEARLTLALAGHPPPVLMRHGQATLLAATDVGLPLGTGLGAPSATLTRWSLQPGDRVLFVTDGTTEARDDRGWEYPILARAAELLASGPLLPSLEALVADVESWTAGDLQDDAALLAVEVLGAVVAPPAGPCPPEADRPPTGRPLPRR